MHCCCWLLIPQVRFKTCRSFKEVLVRYLTVFKKMPVSICTQHDACPIYIGLSISIQTYTFTFVCMKLRQPVTSMRELGQSPIQSQSRGLEFCNLNLIRLILDHYPGFFPSGISLASHLDVPIELETQLRLICGVKSHSGIISYQNCV